MAGVGGGFDVVSYTSFEKETGLFINSAMKYGCTKLSINERALLIIIASL
jgi:hypothetical protein